MPNFEVWWGHREVEEYFLGHPVENEVDAVKFAKEIGIVTRQVKGEDCEENKMV